jgi:hypothetical protein
LLGLLVIEGRLSVSAFVVFLSTLQSFGPTLGSFFVSLFSIGSGYAAIQKLSALLNSQVSIIIGLVLVLNLTSQVYNIVDSESPVE